MDKVTARSPEDSVSVGADSIKDDDDDTEDEILVDVGRDRSLHSSRDERRSKIGPEFKIALYQELQRIKGNPFMGKTRKARAIAWDALATRLRSVKKVTCKGSFGEKTFDVCTPEKCHGAFCSRYFIKERSRRKSLEKEGSEGTGAGPKNPYDDDRHKAEDEEFKKAIHMVTDLKEFITTSSEKDVGKLDSHDADDGSSSHGEEADPPTEKKSRKGKRRREDTAEELDYPTHDPLDDDGDHPISDEVALLPHTQEKLERLCDAIHNMGEKMRSGPGRSADGANISTQLSNFENRIANHFGRISRDIRMIEDEMTRLRRTISSLHDDVLGLAQGHASGPRRGLIQ